MAPPQTAKSPRRSPKLERLEARLNREQKRIIERAAKIRGTTLTDFLLLSAHQAATQTIKDFEMLSLRDAAREIFVQAILHPPQPNAAARAAARRYKARVGQ